MHVQRKSAFVALITSTVVVLLIQIPNACATESTSKEKALAFISDVVMIDLSKYDITLQGSQTSYPPEYGGLLQERVRYILETEESKLDATCVFVNGTYLYCVLGWLKGEPIYTNPQPTDAVDVAKGVLERYQTYSGSSRFQSMRAILDLVSRAENIVVTADNLKLKVTAENTSGFARGTVTFQWLNNVNGIETYGPELTVRNGSLLGFSDRWNIFTIGNDEVTISREEAVKIAKDHARNCSWRIDGATIMDFTLAQEPPMANLSMNVREPLKLYPFWSVKVWLSEVYPGGVDVIDVGIWADTGEVNYVKALSYGGGIVPEDCCAEEGEVSLVAAAAAIIAIIAIVSTLLFLKKRKAK